MVQRAQSNPGLSIRVVEAALGASCGEVGIVLHHADRGGARTVPIAQRNDLTAPMPRRYSRCCARSAFCRSMHSRSISECSQDTGSSSILFFRDAHPSLWPRLLIIEDTRAHWRIDLFEKLKTIGYVEQTRARANVILLVVPDIREPSASSFEYFGAALLPASRNAAVTVNAATLPTSSSTAASGSSGTAVLLNDIIRSGRRPVAIVRPIAANHDGRMSNSVVWPTTGRAARPDARHPGSATQAA